jgi:hypothetical protein
MALLLVLGACSSDPAPTEVDDLARWFWLHHEDGTDKELADGLQKLEKQLAGLEVDAKETAFLTELKHGDVANVGGEGDFNLANARGMLMQNVIKCSFPKTESLFIAPDQKRVHASYDSYTRKYTSSFDDYVSRATKLLLMENTYAVSALGSSYTATLSGHVRFLPARTTGDAPRGAALFYRATLPTPAKFNNDSDYFRQEYQEQIFYERAPEEVVHFFAVWRDIKMSGQDAQGSLLPQITLEQLAGGDDDYEKHCGD